MGTLLVHYVDFFTSFYSVRCGVLKPFADLSYKFANEIDNAHIARSRFLILRKVGGATCFLLPILILFT